MATLQGAGTPSKEQKGSCLGLGEQVPVVTDDEAQRDRLMPAGGKDCSGRKNAMTTGEAATRQQTCFALPHRARRLVLNAVMLGLTGALLAGTLAEPAKAIVLACWVATAGVVLVRTWRAAIRLDDTNLVALTGVTTKRVKRSEIAWIDVRVPRVGEFTRGNGERIVAVLKNGKQVSLTFDPLVRRDCRHLAEVARSLNGLVGQRAK